MDAGDMDEGSGTGVSDGVTRVVLLRHAEVDGHAGDVPITPTGQDQAHVAGRWLAAESFDIAKVLWGGTRRTRETAEGLAAGLLWALGGGEAPPVTDSFALRNPDLYLGGERVTMVSSAAAFAEQVPSMEVKDVLAVPFFEAWLSHPERVGFWVGHSHPPGDTARSVARRIDAFARSLADTPAWRGRTIVGVTHSPVLRAIGLSRNGLDPGEPPYVNGYQFLVRADGHIDTSPVGPIPS